MMNHLERLQARLLLGTQVELISWWLDHEEHGLTAEKEKNWRALLDCLSKVNLCFHDMEESMTRSINELGEHRIRVLEDAERIGQLKAEMQMLHEQNTRLKDSLSEAIELLHKHDINSIKLWRN